MTANIPKITSFNNTGFNRPISQSNSDDQQEVLKLREKIIEIENERDYYRQQNLQPDYTRQQNVQPDNTRQQTFQPDYTRQQNKIENEINLACKIGIAQDYHSAMGEVTGVHFRRNSK